MHVHYLKLSKRACAYARGNVLLYVCLYVHALVCGASCMRVVFLFFLGVRGPHVSACVSSFFFQVLDGEAFFVAS